MLDLSPGKLVAGHTYIINLTATNRFGSSSIDYEITVSNSSNPLGLFVTPFDQIVALSTPVQLTLLLPQHDPTLRIRFGVRSVLDANKTTERWSIPKSSLRHHLYLPSTENQQTDCSLPKAFEALVEICKYHRRCVIYTVCRLSKRSLFNCLKSKFYCPEGVECQCSNLSDYAANPI